MNKNFSLTISKNPRINTTCPHCQSRVAIPGLGGFKCERCGWWLECASCHRFLLSLTDEGICADCHRLKAAAKTKSRKRQRRAA
jgi:hypothetical protein